MVTTFGDLVTNKIFDFGDFLIQSLMDIKCQMQNQTPKGIFPESFSLIHLIVMEELWSQDNFDFSDLLFTY